MKKVVLIIFVSMMILYSCYVPPCRNMSRPNEEPIVNLVFLNSFSGDTLGVNFQRVYAPQTGKDINPYTYDEENRFPSGRFVLPLSLHSDTTRYIFEGFDGSEKQLTLYHPWRIEYQSEECGFFPHYGGFENVISETSFSVERAYKFSDIYESGSNSLYQVVILF